MINPVVDPMPRTNHRVITAVLFNAMLRRALKIVPARRDRNAAITQTGTRPNNCAHNIKIVQLAFAIISVNLFHLVMACGRAEHRRNYPVGR